MSNFVQRIDLIEQTATPVFYRAYEFTASPALLEIKHPTDLISSLTLFGKKNSTYWVQSSTSLDSALSWSDEVQIILTNSYRVLDLTNPPAQSKRFFRAYEQ